MNTELLLTITLVVLLLASEVRNFIERKDYLDRLMAKNLPEYKDNVKPTENKYEEEVDPNLMDIEDAEEELTNTNA